MRNIAKVIEAIRKQVPSNYGDRKYFLDALDDVLDSTKYRAPEAHYVNFEQLAGVLTDWLGEPDTKWKKKIADIFADKIKI